MKVSVLQDKCEGYACCVIAAPEVFDLDPVTGRVVLLLAEPAKELAAEVAEAARDCPVRAITIDEA